MAEPCTLEDALRAVKAADPTLGRTKVIAQVRAQYTHLKFDSRAARDVLEAAEAQCEVCERQADHVAPAASATAERGSPQPSVKCNCTTLEQPAVSLTDPDGEMKLEKVNLCFYNPTTTKNANLAHVWRTHLDSTGGCIFSVLKPFAKRAAVLAGEGARGFSYGKQADGMDDKTHVLVKESVLGDLADELKPLKLISQLTNKVRT